MAEQVGHNVVNHFKSASGSPLADVTANNTSTDSADAGSIAHETHIHSHERPASFKTSSDSAAITNPAAHQGSTGFEAPTTAAEPSAGDAAAGVARDSVAEEKAEYGQGDLLHGSQDDASVGDGHADDRSTADISVDLSVNSDTDTSRADALEKKEGSHHLRTNSVKKPATFSKVSVTKNFMAKTATAAPVAPKIGEKVNPATTVVQLTAKPRLVAKSAGSSLRDLQKSRLGTENAGSPDASKVWNKNRPVQPPPPRQFTDEELKQQYGIHLATRLQTDESGKESKWADIDDDEDDWAPETVVWMDGTKSTLTTQDSAPIEKERKPAPKPPQKPADAVKPTLTSMKRPDQTMTILKPGAAVANQTKQSGSGTLSSGLDKPSLKAKTPMVAPPAKSPWAAVPKVESVSPVVPPMQPPPPPARPQMATQDARAYEPASSILPAREIAADTFDRSWKDSEGGTRELFNSANGRYEPVSEGRQNPTVRKPAVLQRPAPSTTSPAEPSPAFQSRTGSQLDGMWGRRRGSSVSQGSVAQARRLSTNTRGSDLPPAVEDVSDAEMNKGTNTMADARIDSGRPNFSQQSAWHQQMPAQPVEGSEAPEMPLEDQVKRQDRVMREKRELAIKRRQEEEAREEAAKQERLRAKLDALKDAGKSKKEREAEAAAAAASAVITGPATDNASPKIQSPSDSVANEPAITASATDKSATIPETHSLQPSLGQTSYKHPSPTHKPDTSSTLPSISPAAVPERSISSSDDTQRSTQRAHASPRQGARAPYQPPTTTYKAPTSSYSSPGERKPQPYGRSPNPNENAFTPWPTTAPNSNVWGTAGIGNGTFESSSSFAPVPMSQQSSSLPPPPGMTRPATSTRISPQSFGQDSKSPNLPQSQTAEQQQQRPFPPPGMETRPDLFATQVRLSVGSPTPGLPRAAHPPGPIGPPSRSQQPQQAPQPADPIARWNQVAHRLPNQFSSDAQAAYERRKQEANVVSEIPKRTFKETFKQTAIDPDRLGGANRYEKIEYSVHDGQGGRLDVTPTPAPPSVQTQPAGPFATASAVTDSWKQSPANSVRMPENSLNTAPANFSSQQPPIGPPVVQQHFSTDYQGGLKFTAAPLPPVIDIMDSSPPPPEAEAHPVNFGDQSHPHVKLPPPQAKVRLPPASAAMPPRMPANSSSVMMPQRSYPNTYGPAKPIVMNEAWQARFNGLFNRTPIQTEIPPSPPKTPPKMQGPLLAVSSSSRALIDYQANVQSSGATVSLPQVTKNLTPEGFILDNCKDVFSKPTIDHVFNEELSFGSRPSVNIPRNTRYDTSVYPQDVRSMLSMSSNSRLMKSVDSQSKPEIDSKFWFKHNDGYFLRIPRTKLNNKLVRQVSDHVSNFGGRKSSNYGHDKRKFKGNKDDGGQFSPNPNASSNKSTLTGTYSSSSTKTPSTQSRDNFASSTKASSSLSRDNFAERRKSGYDRPRGGAHHSRNTPPTNSRGPPAAVKSD